jgi:hypothetical protein
MDEETGVFAPNVFTQLMYGLNILRHWTDKTNVKVIVSGNFIVVWNENPPEGDRKFPMHGDPVCPCEEDVETLQHMGWTKDRHGGWQHKLD